MSHENFRAHLLVPQVTAPAPDYCKKYMTFVKPCLVTVSPYQEAETGFLVKRAHRLLITENEDILRTKTSTQCFACIQMRTNEITDTTEIWSLLYINMVFLFAYCPCNHQQPSPKHAAWLPILGQEFHDISIDRGIQERGERQQAVVQYA